MRNKHRETETRKIENTWTKYTRGYSGTGETDPDNHKGGKIRQ